MHANCFPAGYNGETILRFLSGRLSRFNSFSFAEGFYSVGDWRITAGVGGVLAVIGAIMLWSHIQTWNNEQQDSNLDEFDRKHFRSKFRRRMQTSAMIVLLGILIPVGDLPAVWNNLGPFWSSLYWIGILMLVMWIILLALGDFASTRAHSKVALSRVRQNNANSKMNFSAFAAEVRMAIHTKLTRR